MNNKIMSKGLHRYQKTDHISRIQANLKEMKNEVSSYLNKSNHTIPPILKPKNYLILSCIHNLNRNQSISPQNITIPNTSKDTSLFYNGQTLQFLSYRKQANKIVKQKRIRTFNKNIPLIDADCLLPNICQLNLDLQDKNVKSNCYSNLLQGKILQSTREENDYEPFLKQRRYHSIDINRKIQLSQHVQNSNAFHVTNKWLSASKSRELIKTIRAKNTWSNQITPIETSNLEKVDVQDDVIKNSRVAYLQRRQILLRKKMEYDLIKVQEKQQNHHKTLQIKQPQRIILKSIKKERKVFKFDNPEKNIKSNKIKKILEGNIGQCSPWQENDNPQKSQSLLQGYIF